MFSANPIPIPSPPIDKDYIYYLLSKFDFFGNVEGLKFFESFVLIPEILFTPVEVYLVVPRKMFLFYLLL